MIIYKTVNQINGKYYIGKDEKANPAYLGSGLALGRAINKYGRENFIKEIIEVCVDSSTLAERERFWIKEYNAVLDSSSYNVHEGGFGGNTGAYYKVGRKGKLNSQYRRKYTTEEKLKLSKKMKKYFATADAAILGDRHRRSGDTQRGNPKNALSVNKMQATKKQYWAGHNATCTLYTLTAPSGREHNFKVGIYLYNGAKKTHIVSGPSSVDCSRIYNPNPVH